jgi:hypothetical protein
MYVQYFNDIDFKSFKTNGPSIMVGLPLRYVYAFLLVRFDLIVKKKCLEVQNEIIKSRKSKERQYWEMTMIDNTLHRKQKVEQQEPH